MLQTTRRQRPSTWPPLMMLSAIAVSPHRAVESRQRNWRPFHRSSRVSRGWQAEPTGRFPSGKDVLVGRKRADPGDHDHTDIKTAVSLTQVMFEACRIFNLVGQVVHGHHEGVHRGMVTVVIDID